MSKCQPNTLASSSQVQRLPPQSWRAVLCASSHTHTVVGQTQHTNGSEGAQGKACFKGPAAGLASATQVHAAGSFAHTAPALLR